MTGIKYLIGAEQLSLHLGQPNWRVVDCRFNLMKPEQGYEEYLQDHIPGALYADLDKDLAAPVSESTGRHPLPLPDSFADTLGAWGIDNDTQVVVYDQASGAIAARLWWMMNWLGHEQVAVLDGGYTAWQKADLPVSDSVPPVEAVNFSPSPDWDLLTSTDELEASIEAGDAPLIVDARDRARFDGKTEPIDSVAGHIPGAVNHPFSEAIDSEGCWKTAEELRQSWETVLGEHSGQRWISMCGSGVTACHLALSAAHVGYRLPSLYVGSWSEWIRNPERPIATNPD